MMRERWTSVALLLIACLTLAAAGPAWAHAKLIDSEPAGGDVLAKAPERVRLIFDEPVRFEEGAGAEPSPLDPIKVYSEEGARVDKNATRASPDDPKVLLVDLEKLPDGVYGVDWGVTSKDGHVIDGTLGFTVEVAGAQREGAVGPEAEDEGGSLEGIFPVWVVVAVVVVGGGLGLIALVAALRRR
jgi:methionine-rich copper-binding protein CopC